MTKFLRALAGVLMIVTFHFHATDGHAYQPIEGLVNVRFQSDVRIFAVMAAANVPGPGRDFPDESHNQVRRAVHARLTRVEAGLLERIRVFAAAHDPETDESSRLAKYVSYSLFLNGPPSFSLSVKPSALPPEIRPLAGFEGLVSELWTAGDFASLWSETRPEYLREIEAYRPLIRSMIISTLKYMHTDARVALDRQVIFIPDLLNGFEVVNARNIGPDYVVVVGPSEARERPMRAVRHEYLHFFVDPLVYKYREYMPDPNPFLDRIQVQPRVVPAYEDNFTLMLTESLIKVLELKLDRKSDIREGVDVDGLYEQGLILAPYFEDSLGRFERRSESLQEFFPDLIKGIKWSDEEARARPVQSVQKAGEVPAPGTNEKVAPGRDSRPPGDVGALLKRANGLLQDRKFDLARGTLEEVLKLDPQNANAWFGMAQVASHENNLALALDYYDRASSVAGKDTWIAAWCLVHRGNIYQFMGDDEKARVEWSKVLKLEGELRGADEAARNALKR